MRSKDLWQSFSYAFSGLGWALKTQRNLRIHLVVGTVALALGWLSGLRVSEMAILAVAIALVITAELINTAFEALADASAPQFNPQIRIAKDVAAAGVLLAALGALAVAIFLLLPPILLRLSG